MRATAKTQKSLHISMVWIIPIIALIITAVLIWRNSFDHGPVIELTMHDAEGIEAGKTLVKVRAVTVGKVISVKLDRDYLNAVASIQMDKGTENLLRRDSQFWVVKPRVESTSITGLDTLLSGAYIQLERGRDQDTGTQFTALDQPPITSIDTAGKEITIITEEPRRLNNGESVYFRGFEVGKVISSRLDTESRIISYSIVIRDPYIDLVTNDTKFWISSGISFNLGAEGVKVNAESLDNMLRGGISFDSFGPRNEQKADLSLPFYLFKDQDSAYLNAIRSGIKYAVIVPHNLGNLSQGSAVMMNGAKIGEIVDAPWYEDERAPFASDGMIPVLLALNISAYNAQYVKDTLDQALGRHELCARAAAANLLSGTNRLVLSYEKPGSCKAANADLHGVRVIPLLTQPSLSDQAGQIMRQLAAFDVKGISDKTKQALDQVRHTAASIGQSADAFNHEQSALKLSQALTAVSRTLDSYGPESDIYIKLQQLMIDLKAMLNELKPAASQIGQQPNSIIFNHNAPDPMPRARRN